MNQIYQRLASFVILGIATLLLFTGVSPYQNSFQHNYLPLVIKNPNPDLDPTATPPTNTGSDYNIPVGPGYTDVSPKQLVRTSTNRLYVAVSTCNSYPCIDTAQKLRMYQASSIGTPVGFKHVDASAEPGAVAGWAIAIDGNNRIHVAWTDRSTSASTIDRLRYTSFDTATNTWSRNIETIDGELNVSLDGGGQGMQSVALALDANGVPHIVYLRKAASDPNRRIYYRNKIGGTWSAARALDDTISYSSNQRAWHPNLAFDSAGRILAVWERGSFNRDNDGTIFGRVRETNGTWQAAVNISGNNAARVTIDQSTSLLITPDNRYHIAWISAPNDYIRYQYSNNLGQSWSFNNPSGGTQATHNPSLGYANGKLRIYGHDTPIPQPDDQGDNMLYFQGNGGSASWGSWTKIVTGDYDSSVNTRWSQYFHSFPNTVDIAYWDENYPNQLFVGTEVLAP